MGVGVVVGEILEGASLFARGGNDENDWNDWRWNDDAGEGAMAMLPLVNVNLAVGVREPFQPLVLRRFLQGRR